MLYPKALESNLGTSDFPFFPIQASSLKGELTCTIFPAAFGPRVAGRPGEQSGTDGVSFSSHFITATGLRQKNTKTHIRCCHCLQFLYKRLLSNAPRSYSLLLIQLVFNFPSGITDAEISADTFFKQSLIPERCKPTPQTYLPQKNKQTNNKHLGVSFHRSTYTEQQSYSSVTPKSGGGLKQTKLTETPSCCPYSWMSKDGQRLGDMGCLLTMSWKGKVLGSED